jgi:hypothetical protein
MRIGNLITNFQNRADRLQKFGPFADATVYNHKFLLATAYTQQDSSKEG